MAAQEREAQEWLKRIVSACAGKVTYSTLFIKASEIPCQGKVEMSGYDVVASIGFFCSPRML
jgi:hypothetical protein